MDRLNLAFNEQQRQSRGFVRVWLPRRREDIQSVLQDTMISSTVSTQEIIINNRMEPMLQQNNNSTYSSNQPPQNNEDDTMNIDELPAPYQLDQRDRVNFSDSDSDESTELFQPIAESVEVKLEEESLHLDIKEEPMLQQNNNSTYSSNQPPQNNEDDTMNIDELPAPYQLDHRDRVNFSDSDSDESTELFQPIAESVEVKLEEESLDLDIKEEPMLQQNNNSTYSSNQPPQNNEYDTMNIDDLPAPYQLDQRDRFNFSDSDSDESTEIFQPIAESVEVKLEEESLDLDIKEEMQEFEELEVPKREPIAEQPVNILEESRSHSVTEDITEGVNNCDHQSVGQASNSNESVRPPYRHIKTLKDGTPCTVDYYSYASDSQPATEQNSYSGPTTRSRSGFQLRIYYYESSDDEDNDDKGDKDYLPNNSRKK